MEGSREQPSHGLRFYEAVLAATEYWNHIDKPWYEDMMGKSKEEVGIVVCTADSNGLPKVASAFSLG